jgi:hypothetical protein
MEYLIGLGVLGLGYQLQTNKDIKVKKNFIGTVPKSQQPSQENTYTSKLAYNIFQDEQKKADILLEKSKYPQDTNVVTPGPPFPIMYNKVDYTQSSLPVEFNSYTQYDNIVIDSNDNDKNKERNFNRIQNNKSMPDSGGFQGISLTGDPIDPNNFTHNNQVPYYGGNVRQN